MSDERKCHASRGQKDENKPGTGGQGRNSTDKGSGRVLRTSPRTEMHFKGDRSGYLLTQGSSLTSPRGKQTHTSAPGMILGEMQD